MFGDKNAISSLFRNLLLIGDLLTDIVNIAHQMKK